MDIGEAVLYRLAFGLACDLAEADEARIAGRWAGHAAAGASTAVILREVMKRLASGPGVDPEVVKEGVEDACAGRRPQW